MSSLESFILANKTIDEIIVDLKAKFPVFAGLSDEVLTSFIEMSFCNIPGGFVNCGFTCAYQGFLYGVAHNLAYQDALGTGGIVSLKKNVASKTAGGLSISYQNETSSGTPSNIFNYFGTTAYGQTMLSMLDTCGLTSTPGGYVV